jgi:hypothetical protein
MRKFNNFNKIKYYLCLTDEYPKWKKGHIYPETSMGVEYPISHVVTEYPYDWKLIENPFKKIKTKKYKCLAHGYRDWNKGHIYDETEAGSFSTMKWALENFPEDWELVTEKQNFDEIKFCLCLTDDHPKWKSYLGVP